MDDRLADQKPFYHEPRERDHMVAADMLQRGSRPAHVVAELIQRHVDPDAAEKLVYQWLVDAGTDSESAAKMVYDRQADMPRARPVPAGVMILLGALMSVGGVVLVAAFGSGLDLRYGLAGLILSFIGVCLLKLGQGSGEWAHRLGKWVPLIVTVAFALVLWIIHARASVWTTYADLKYGFSTQYPASWATTIDKADPYTVVFQPQYSWLPDERQLAITVMPGPPGANLTADDCLALLKTGLLSGEGVQVVEEGLHTIGEYPGAQAGIEMNNPSGRVFSCWYALYEKGENVVLLQVCRPSLELKQMKGLFDRFVAGHRP